MPQLPVLVVPRIRGRFPIDGDLNKPPWSALQPIGLVASHGRDAAGGAPLVQPTALRVCHDGERLYVAFDCVDRDVWGTFRGRNERIYDEEVVEAFLAPSGDPRRYFELESNPRGAYWEGVIDNPDGRRATMRSDLEWVCTGWERAIRVRGTRGPRDDVDEGWAVEWAIPFAALSAASPRPGARWRANFHRIDRPSGASPREARLREPLARVSRAESNSGLDDGDGGLPRVRASGPESPNGGEYSAWSPTFAEPAEFHLPNYFGVLEFA